MMKKVKVYKTVIDELDFIQDLVILLEEPLEEGSILIKEYPLEDVEYEDIDGHFHYIEDIFISCLKSLGFVQISTCDYKYVKNNKLIAFKKLPDKKIFMVQRQS